MSTFYRVQIGNFNVDFTFGLGVSQQQALNNIQQALVTAVQQAPSTLGFQPQKIVNALIRTSGYANIAELYSVGNFTNQLKLTSDTWTYRLTVLDGQGRTNLWQGALNYFSTTEQNKVAKPFSSYKDKVVRFVYNGGSDPQSTRLVKVTSYDGTHLHGTDLVKNGIRQFHTDKISNIEVVNI